MKNIKLIALLVCLTVIVCTFAGCAKTALLTFELNGGELAGEAPGVYSDDAVLALPTPALQYYEFLGWSLNSDLSGDLYTELPAGFALSGEQIPSEDTMTALIEKITGNAPYTLTLYAVFNRLSANITFDVNGGEFEDGEDIPTSYLYGETVELPIPELEYFEFVAWVDADGNEIEEITEDMEGDIALTATWIQVETQIFFDLGIVKDIVSVEDALPDAGETFPTDEGIEDLSDAEYLPTADGYQFVGWYADAELTQPIDSIDSDTTDPVTIYAKWEQAPVVEGDNWVGVK